MEELEEQLQENFNMIKHTVIVVEVILGTQAMRSR